MSTCNRLDLQTRGSQPVMPKNLPDHWHASVIWEMFGHNRLVEILVILNPTGGYMLTSSSFPLLNWGTFYKFLLNNR